MKSNAIKTLTPIEHIMLRPQMYVGGMPPSDHVEWLLDDEDKISQQKVSYSEALLKICNEAIDNSMDVFVKSNGKFGNKIKVTITKDSFTCEDNGCGIPTTKGSDGQLECVSAMTVPMSGSNFDDDEDHFQAGMNGLGIKAANIFSKEFECTTTDKNNTVTIKCSNNLSETKVKVLAARPSTGTKVSFKPDFKRFSVKEFDKTIFQLIKTRLKILTWFFPDCVIYFNGERVNLKGRELNKLFPQPTVTLDTEDCYICIYPSDEGQVFTYVNGISLREAGTHVDYISNIIVQGIREKVSKKYKSIMPADIRNRLGIVVFMNHFPNCSFDSQTKKKLTNAFSDIGNFLRDKDVDLQKLITKVLLEKEIVSNITELFRLKEELAAQKEMEKLDKKKKEVNSDKYFPPVGKTEQKYLMITEGFSAFSGISPILGRKSIGYYMLRGKVKNVLDLKPLQYKNNVEISEIIDILGLKWDGSSEDMNYDYVVILTDADADGTAIAGLIITLFSKIAPKILKQGRLCRLNTPLLTGKNKKGEIEKYFYSFPKKTEMSKSLDWFYLKGLGSWQKKDLQQIIEKEGGLDKMIEPFTFDKSAEKAINDWYGRDTQPRKEFLRGREFHVDSI